MRTRAPERMLSLDASQVPGKFKIQSEKMLSIDERCVKFLELGKRLISEAMKGHLFNYDRKESRNTAENWTLQSIIKSMTKGSVNWFLDPTSMHELEVHIYKESTLLWQSLNAHWNDGDENKLGKTFSICGVYFLVALNCSLNQLVERGKSQRELMENRHLYSKSNMNRIGIAMGEASEA